MATTYTVNRSTSSGTEVAIATGIGSQSFVDATAVNGHTYFYTVTATNAFGSTTSSEVSVTI